MSFTDRYRAMKRGAAGFRKSNPKKASAIIGTLVAAVVAILAIVVGSSLSGPSHPAIAQGTTAPSASSSASATTAPSITNPGNTSKATPVTVNCATSTDTWSYSGSTSAQVVSGGSDKIRLASYSAPSDQVHTIADETIDQAASVRPANIGAYAQVWLGKTYTNAQLTASNGCASPLAKAVVSKVKSVMAASKVSIADAPKDGLYNTYINHDKLVYETTAGVSGDRKAIKIVGPDGKVRYILARCLNPYTGLPQLPGYPCSCDTPTPTVTPTTPAPKPSKTPTPTPTPSNTPPATTPPVTTPPTTTPPAPIAPTITIHAKNDVDQEYTDSSGTLHTSTAQDSVYYSVGGSDYATITIMTGTPNDQNTPGHGTFAGGDVLTFKVHGSGTITFTYVAPGEVPAGGYDTIYATIQDTTNPQLAPGIASTKITINAKSACSIPNSGC